MTVLIFRPIDRDHSKDLRMILNDVFCPLVVFVSCSLLNSAFQEGKMVWRDWVESVPRNRDLLYSFLPFSKAFCGLYPEHVLPRLQTVIQILQILWNRILSLSRPHQVPYYVLLFNFPYFPPSFLKRLRFSVSVPLKTSRRNAFLFPLVFGWACTDPGLGSLYSIALGIKT